MKKGCSPQSGRLMATSAPASESLKLQERLQQLRFALSQGNVRVVELFRSIDTDRSGEIEKGEFIKAMREWGLDATKAELSDSVVGFEHAISCLMAHEGATAAAEVAAWASAAKVKVRAR